MPRNENTPQRGPSEVDGRYLRPFAQKLAEMLIAGGRSHYDQGKMVDEVCRGRYWDKWPDGPIKNFPEWTWKVLGCRSRRAEILRGNYNKLAAMNVAEDTLVRALRLGWCKLAHLLKLAKDEPTLLRWIDRVEDENLSENDLRALSKQKTGDADAAPATEAEKKVAFKLVFEDKTALDTFLLALKVIQKRYDPEMGWGRAAALMATSYAASVPRDDEGGAPVELHDLLLAIEHTYRVRLKVDEESQPAPPPRLLEKMHNTDAVRSASLDL